MSNKANDENITSGSVPKLHVSSDRTALGQLSPNRQSSTLLNTSHEEQTKLLKRSIINPIDASRGFQYLKRRRLSSSIGQPPQRTSNEISNAQRTDLRVRSHCVPWAKLTRLSRSWSVRRTIHTSLTGLTLKGIHPQTVSPSRP